MKLTKEVQKYVDKIEVVYRVGTAKYNEEYLRQLKLAWTYIQVLQALVPAHFDYTKTKEYKAWTQVWNKKGMCWRKRRNWAKVAMSIKT